MPFILLVLVFILFLCCRTLEKQMESIQSRMHALINDPTEPFAHEWAGPMDFPKEEPAPAPEPPPTEDPTIAPETPPEPEPVFSTEQPSEEPAPSAKSTGGIKDLEAW